MTGLQSARIFAGRGLRVLGVAQDTKHYACRSKRLDSIHAYRRDEGDLLRVIREIASTIEGPFLLLPCADWSVLELSLRRDELPSNARIVLPPHETLQTLMDKSSLEEFARSAGIGTPRTMQMSVGAGDVDVESLTFPVVVKPARKSPAWDGAIPTKVVVCDDPSRLREVATSLPESVGTLIVQEWIPGGEDQLYSCNVYIDRSGDVLGSFVARKLRQWPPNAGTSASGESVLDSRVSELAARLFSKAGHRGLGYVEMKYDERFDTYIVIEPNLGRPTGRSAIAEGGRVDLLYTAYCDAVGIEVPPARAQRKDTNKWIYIRHDLQAAAVAVRRGELTWSAWLESIRGPKMFAVWSLSDPLPFVVDLWATLMKSVGRLRRRSSMHR